MSEKIYDVAIIGGGPAGLTAAIYTARETLSTILLEKSMTGGIPAIVDQIENYPGFPDGITGPDLMQKMRVQADRFGTFVSEFEEVSKILPERGRFKLVTENNRYQARAVIIASGGLPRNLGIESEQEFLGRGVSYCATCDGPLFKGKDIVVVGGGDTALEDALFLTKFANKVTVVHRRDKLRATKILQERARANKKIHLQLDSVAVEVKGTTRVEALEIKDVHSGKISQIKTDGVFVLIGITPNSGLVSDIVKTDDKGYIMTDDEMRTSVDGLFACGDVRKKLLRQVVTAAGDGATAAFSAEHYVEGLK